MFYGRADPNVARGKIRFGFGYDCTDWLPYQRAMRRLRRPANTRMGASLARGVCSGSGHLRGSRYRGLLAMAETAPLLSRMKRTHTYSPLGGCIYHISDQPAGPFRLEHIIPESLGGMLELPAASCVACESVTSAFEGENAGKLFLPIRRQYKFPSKQRGAARGLARQHDTFLLKIDGKKRKIPATEYPGFLMSFVFPYPTILLGQPVTAESFSGGVTLGTLPEFGERLNRLRAKYGQKVEFPTRGSAEAAGRLLAKIAHSYAVAEIGFGSFRPCLLGIIRNQDPFLLRHLVGSSADKAPLSEDLHEIGILPRGQLGPDSLVVVRIHLFANHHGMPVHYVVIGEYTPTQ
jgi:hypothetical protein